MNGQDVKTWIAAAILLGAGILALAALRGPGPCEPLPAQAPGEDRTAPPVPLAGGPELCGGGPDALQPGEEPPAQAPPPKSPQTPPLVARFEEGMAGGNLSLPAFRAGLVAGDDRVVEGLLRNEEWAPALGPQLLLLFPGRPGLADRLLEILPSSGRFLAERVKLGDPHAILEYLEVEGRRTPLLDSVLGGRPSSVEAARVEAERIRNLGYGAYGLQRARALLQAEAPALGSAEHVSYHAFFHRLACVLDNGPEKTAVLRAYVVKFLDDGWFAASFAGRRNVCQVLVESGSRLGLAGLVDIVARPKLRAAAVRGRPGEIAWSIPRKKDSFVADSYYAEKILLSLTPFEGRVCQGVDFDPASRQWLFDEAALDEARTAWRTWWLRERDRLAWDPAASKFVSGPPTPDLHPLWARMDACYSLRAGQFGKLAGE